ncbi:MAG: transglutaminase domain-containing protein [Thermodesulfobacteriota bacterium]
MKKKWPRYALALGLLLGIGLFVWFYLTKQADSYTLPKQIRYSFTVQNITNQVIKDGVLSVYAPVKQTSAQLCTAIETSYPHELVVDTLGNQILTFSFSEYPPFATKIITIKADLLFADKPVRRAVSRKDRDLFLQPEKYVECDQPAIASQARAFKNWRALRTAENVFKWVADNIQSDGYVRNERGALYALTAKKGDCTEYMDLFTALCRAAKIPTRRVGGYVCPGNAVLSASEFHNWAEFYHSRRWYLADPQNRVFMKNAENYVAMRIISDAVANDMQGSNRFHVRGEGLTVKMDM